MNFAYNYLANMEQLQRVLLTPYLKGGKILQNIIPTDNGRIIEFRDFETEELVAYLISEPPELTFYEKSNKDQSEDNQQFYPIL